MTTSIDLRKRPRPPPLSPCADSQNTVLRKRPRIETKRPNPSNGRLKRRKCLMSILWTPSKLEAFGIRFAPLKIQDVDQQVRKQLRPRDYIPTESHKKAVEAFDRHLRIRSSEPNFRAMAVQNLLNDYDIPTWAARGWVSSSPFVNRQVVIPTRGIYGRTRPCLAYLEIPYERQKSLGKQGLSLKEDPIIAGALISLAREQRHILRKQPSGPSAPTLSWFKVFLLTFWPGNKGTSFYIADVSSKFLDTFTYPASHKSELLTVLYFDIPLDSDRMDLALTLANSAY